MPVYDADRFEPPAPIGVVTLSDPATGARYDGIRMLIDTGADISIVPLSALNQLGLALTEPVQYEVTGFGEGHAALPAVELRMIFLGHSFRGHSFRGQFLVADQAHGILGRNVLNAVRILLDGPGLLWREHQP